MILHGEFNSQHRENFEVLKIKKTFQCCGRCGYNLLTFEVNIELEGQTNDGITFATNYIAFVMF